MPERRGLPGPREQNETPRPRSPLTGRGLGASVHTWGLELGLSGAAPGVTVHHVGGEGGHPHSGASPSPDGARGPRGGVPAAFLTAEACPRIVRPHRRTHICIHAHTRAHTQGPADSAL